MSKLSMAACLSLSMVALGFAGVALMQVGSNGVSTSASVSEDDSLREAVRSIKELAINLRTETDQFRMRIEKIERIAVGSSKSGKEVKEPGGADVVADIAALNERLESVEEKLESLGSDENIAELARSGFARARKKEVEGALDLVLDTSQPARERLRAWQSLRKGGGKGKGQGGPPEALQSIIDLARDTSLGPELREEAVKSLRGERSEEVKEPMLSILAEDDDPQVRRRSLEVLMWHGGDPAVLETITAISREDRHEGVQQHAEAILPKVQHFAREAEARDERGGDSK